VPNRKVTLLWYCRTPRGWRRFPVVMGRNNRIKHAHVVDSGIEVAYPDGHYETRRYEGKKPVYTNVGSHASDAVAARDKESHLMVAKESATAAGAKVVEEGKRTYLRRVCELYIQDARNRKAMEAAEQARLVTDEFMLVSKKTFVDELTREDIYSFHKALEKRGCVDRTIANKHARLKSVLMFAGVDTKAIMPPKPKYELEKPTTYTSAEITAIRAVADEYMRLVIDLGLKLGLRDQEITYAEWTDIDFEESAFRVQGKKHWEFAVKDSEQRDIPIGKDLMKSLQVWRKKHPESRLIVPTATGIPNAKLLRALKRLAKHNGLNCGLCEGCKSKLGECGTWTLHKLRRTFVTTLLRNNFDLSTVQNYAGHSDLASTMRYLSSATGKETKAKINAINWG
jgi:integrase